MTRPMMRVRPPDQVGERMVGAIARRHRERGAREQRKQKQRSDRRVEHGSDPSFGSDDLILGGFDASANVHRRTADRSSLR